MLIVGDASSNTIGGVVGTTPGGSCTGACNLISGNADDGVRIGGANTSSNVIQGNYIGTDVHGTGDVGNTDDGLHIEDGASDNLIGGTTPEARNLISGNEEEGIVIRDNNTVNNRVEGNYIGLDVTGAEALSNTRNGVEIRIAPDNFIGGTMTGAGNVISGNGDSGVLIIDVGSTNNVVQGNYIGTDATGTRDIGNTRSGVTIALGASSNMIGGVIPEARNIISGNGNDGVRISDDGTIDNFVEGNYIGTQANGIEALGNAFSGVFITDGPSDNVIGGVGESGNTIAFNDQDGVALAPNGGTGNAIRGNAIFKNTDLGIDLNQDGSTGNDAKDVDAGPNNLQNVPDVTDVVIDTSGALIVTYSVDTDTTRAIYPLTIEFFKADDDGEEGQIPLDTLSTYTTADYDVCAAPPCADTTGLGSASALGIAADDRLVATVTDADGNTSEFAGSVVVAMQGRNTPPRIVGTISNIGLNVEGMSTTIDLAPVFEDPDGDVLRFSARLSTPGVVTIDISPDFVLTVTPVAIGLSTVIVTAGDGNGGMTDESFRVKVGPRLLFPYAIDVAFGSTRDSTGYRLVGLPGEASTPLSLGLDGEVGKDWIVYTDNGGSTYPDYLTEFTGSFRPGRGYWVLSKHPMQIDTTVEAVELDGSDDSYPIALPHNGWNIISNPLDIAVRWDSVLAFNGIESNPVLYSYNGGYNPVTTFASTATRGEAFYFNRTGTGLSQLRIPYPGLAVIPKITPLPPPTRVLTLAAYYDDRRVADVRVGTAQQAKPGHDAYDTIGPPGVFEAVSLRLVNERFTTPRSELAAEFRPEGRDGEVFEVMLRAQENTLITLEVEGLDAFAFSDIYLVDRKTSKHYDLHAQPSLSLTASGEQDRYSLVVGSAAFVEETTEAFVPETLALLANYPNPFNPSTVIEYAVPVQEAGAVVRLEVFNLLGQRVRVLVDAPHAPGLHRITWDGSDATGAQVASGVYLYRLSVSGHRQVRRMLLVK